MKWLAEPPLNILGPPSRSVQIAQRKVSDLTIARNLTQAARYEEAAEIYEKWSMFEEAGRVRRLDREQVVRYQVSSVDINRLIQQLREGGLVAVYKCPNCGGSIRVSGATDATSLTRCGYCNSYLQAQDLATFLQSVLG